MVSNHMIIIDNIDNNICFEWGVVGYEFPDLSTGSDANWCQVKVKVVQDDKVFETIDPALETYDLIKIQQWFKDLSQKRLPKYAHLEFIEPCMSFEFASHNEDKVNIAIHLNYELKPHFDLIQFGIKYESWKMIFELTQNDFENILMGLERTTKMYPIRSEKG